MKFYAEENDYLGKIFIIETENNKLQIFYGGNLDLYFVVANETPIIVTKEFYQVYKIFNNLFYNLENGFIFDNNMNNIENIKDYKLRLDRYKKLAKELGLYKNNIITFKSDEVRDLFLKNDNNEKNELIITKVADNIVIKANLNLEKFPYSHGIRFRMNGSYYDSLVYVFAKMYKELEEIDINNYQIHMEEYMFLFVKHLVKNE